LKFVSPPKSVSGSVAIAGSYITDPTNSNLGSETFSGSSGAITATLQDSYSEVETAKQYYLDLYQDGAMTLTGAGGTYQISYVGTGVSYANGKFSETLTGAAVGTSGLVNGQVGVFTASVLGYFSPDGSESAKLTFKIQN
jgi:hypothetical protein